LETCGLDPETCDILEFGAVLDDLKNQRPIKMLPTFHCYFAQPAYKGEPYALSMHGKIFERIASKEKGYDYYAPTKFGMTFKRFLMQNGYECERDIITINVAGKNFGAFDLQFLNRQTDLRKHVKISHKFLDPAILFVDRDDNRLPGLSDCKKRAGMSEHVAHTAVADAMDVVQLIREGLSGKFPS
jgi:oligoribonuclease